MSSVISQEAPAKRILLMGNEAIARGAVEAGVEVVAAYPGTPSSEICEVLAESADTLGHYIEWSTNEKVAFEVAAGASLVGARALVAMKNAGLNVAMDTFMTLPYTGTNGGMVIVVADDPAAHYSSTEQDTRLAAAYAEILCLEPADQQEAKDMTREAFELSEKLGMPVFVRSVTRLSHASGDVVLGDIRCAKSERGFNKHWKHPYRWNVYGPPSGAMARHKWLHEQLSKVAEEAEASCLNSLICVDPSHIHDGAENGLGSSRRAKIGIISSGLGSCYAREALDCLGLSDAVPFLKLGTVYPLPRAKTLQLLDSVDSVLVIEEGDPLVELQVKALVCDAQANVKVLGKTASEQVFAPYGEMNTDLVVAAIARAMAVGEIGCSARGSEDADGHEADESARSRLRSLVIPRSSTLCAGCPHLGSYWALRETLRTRKGVHIVNGDIGCYEQGGYGIFSQTLQGDEAPSRRFVISSPYEILDTIYVMGSGIGLAMGQAQAGYNDGKIVAVAGDSTFFHATLPALVNAVYTAADVTFLVLDNSWTCMTGHQPSPTTGVDVSGDEVRAVSIEAVARSIGIESLAVVDAYDIAAAKAAISEALEYDGPSVVVLRRECALQVQRRKRSRGGALTIVDNASCIGCRLCVELGCPAVTFDADARKAGIDSIMCVDCGLCVQVCSKGAIRPSSNPACHANHYGGSEE